MLSNCSKRFKYILVKKKNEKETTDHKDLA